MSEDMRDVRVDIALHVRTNLPTAQLLRMLESGLRDDASDYLAQWLRAYHEARAPGDETDLVFVDSWAAVHRPYISEEMEHWRQRQDDASLNRADEEEWLAANDREAQRRYREPQDYEPDADPYHGESSAARREGRP